MKTQRIQAAFARRREADHNRIERTAAVNRYFDHWGKITSRFETWADEDYYKQADDTVRKEKEKKLKDKKLEERREKLKHLLDQENAKYAEELRLLDKPKARRVSVGVLEKIDKDRKEVAAERRRLELESKLYSKWRYGTHDDHVLFESKSTNHTLAKMNWLDKQIEDCMAREEDAKQAEERQIKLMEETRKREENLKEQQKIREVEIKELRNLQESHINELKSREIQSNDLREKESQYRQILEKIERELSDLSIRKNENRHNTMPHNIKHIKMFIRQRSEQIRDDLGKDILLLDRFSKHIPEQVMIIKENFQTLYNTEIGKQSDVEAMYESEAKNYLLKWEGIWEQQAKEREVQILKILNKIKSDLENDFSENLRQQRCLVQVRETHLTAIENSNDKLKTIVKEQGNFTQMSDLSDSSIRSSGDDGILQISNCSLGENSSTQPRFGRKKVAWT